MAIDNELERNRAARIKRPPKGKTGLRKKSLKRQAEDAAEEKLLSSDGDTFLEQWHKAGRKAMTGTCQCGCGEPSQKKDDKWYRGSNAHIFPKEHFLSIMYHPLNRVERRMWAGYSGTSACHTNMDDRSMELWPNFADWDDIKEKFYILAPLLTEQERDAKFYKHLKKLVYEN